MFDAYHQRELKSCNRSKKHPWAVKSRSEGEGGDAEGNVCSGHIPGDRLYFGEGGGGWPNQTIHRHWFNVTAVSGCKCGNSRVLIGQDSEIALLGPYKLIHCQQYGSAQVHFSTQGCISGFFRLPSEMQSGFTAAMQQSQPFFSCRSDKSSVIVWNSINRSGVVIGPHVALLIRVSQIISRFSGD